MTKKKAYQLAGTLITITILASNLTPLNTLYKWSFDSDYYSYSNLSGTVTFTENLFKNRTIGQVEQFSKVKPECMVRGFESDTLMYRLFKKNPLAFWRWMDYLTDDRFTLPFARWETIQKSREGYIDTLKSTPCRDF